MPDQPKSDLFSLDPRQRFQRSLKTPADFKALVADPMIQDAVQDTLSHMAILGCSRDQLDGAVTFAHIFLNFAEPEQPPTKLPIKRLSVQ